MNITELLSKEAMIMDLQASDKEAAIAEMVQKLYDTNRISNIEVFKEGILAREAQTSTGLGDGIAMPHAKNASVKEATVLFAKSRNGVDYAALDNQPVYLFFMIAAPEGANDTHLQALAALSRQLVHKDFVEQLKTVETPEDVHTLFRLAEEVPEEREEKSAAGDADQRFVVAVTACPTGIAHTYMAEDALKQMAEKMGVAIKVETNGTDGVRNRLTESDIARAEGVIIAADKNVEMNRFDGKNLISRPVSDGIRKPEKLINEILAGNAPVYHSQSDSQTAEKQTETSSIGQKIYKDLMNGVSHMLPFVIGGGIARCGSGAA